MSVVMSLGAGAAEQFRAPSAAAMRQQMIGLSYAKIYKTPESICQRGLAAWAHRIQRIPTDDRTIGVFRLFFLPGCWAIRHSNKYLLHTMDTNSTVTAWVILPPARRTEGAGSSMLGSALVRAFSSGARPRRRHCICTV